jgi:hypothetical protein
MSGESKTTSVEKILNNVKPPSFLLENFFNKGDVSTTKLFEEFLQIYKNDLDLQLNIERPEIGNREQIIDEYVKNLFSGLSLSIVQEDTQEMERLAIQILGNQSSDGTYLQYLDAKGGLDARGHRAELLSVYQKIDKNSGLGKIPLLKNNVMQVFNLTPEKLQEMVRKGQKLDKKKKKRRKKAQEPSTQLMNQVVEQNRQILEQNRSLSNDMEQIRSYVRSMANAVPKKISYESPKLFFRSIFEADGPMQTHNLFFIEVLKAAAMPINKIRTYMPRSLQPEQDYGTTVGKFFASWIKSIMKALYDMLWEPVEILKNWGDFLNSIAHLDLGERLRKTLKEVMKHVVFFSVSACIIYVYVDIVRLVIWSFDNLFGTEFSFEFKLFLDEYMGFVNSLLMDAFKLPHRVFLYLICGYDDIEEDMTVPDILLRSDMRVWYSIRSLIDLVWGWLTAYAASWDTFLKTNNQTKKMYSGLQGFTNQSALIFDYLAATAKEAARIMRELEEARRAIQEEMERRFKEFVGELSKPGFGLIGDSVTQFISYAKEKVTGATSYLLLTGGRGAEYPAQPVLGYTVFHVCQMLDIKKKDFDNLNDQKLVHYVNKNNLNGIELVHVLYRTIVALDKRALQSPVLRF